MSNVLQDNLKEQERLTARDRFLDQLTGYVFVDMGTINNVAQTENGYRCNVNTFRLTGSQPTIYDGVELLMLGSATGGINFDLDGSDCIVFGPFSAAVAVGTGSILGPNKPYNPKYLKCLPVSNPAYWDGILEFDIDGNLSYKTETALFRLTVNGSISYIQDNPQQEVIIESDGDIIVKSPSYMFYHRPDGTYYRRVSGVSPGNISFFESYLDNIKDTFWTSIADFQPADNDEEEWQQLLKHKSWRRHEQYASGTLTIKLYNSDNKLVSTETIKPDGSRSLLNTDADGNNMFKQDIATDGTVNIQVKEDTKITVTDGIITVKIKDKTTITTKDKDITLEVDKTKLTTNGSKWNIDANGCAVEITDSKVTVAGNLEVSK